MKTLSHKIKNIGVSLKKKWIIIYLFNILS